MRISVLKPTAERLAAYDGTYYSEELDALYTVWIKAGDLHLRLPKEDIEMVAGSHDVFYGAFAGERLEVNFHCGRPRSCDSFQVSTGNGWVQNLLFRRIELPSAKPASH